VRASDIYVPFVNGLQRYNNKEMSIKELYDYMQIIMGAYPDLFEDFKQFIPLGTTVTSFNNL
jgi:histone deacetylase complex regulatory component SIN3